MADEKKAPVHPKFAERIVAKLPPKLKAETEVKEGGGEYTIIRVRGRSIVSVRDRAVRIVHPHGGKAEEANALARLIADAAPEKKPEAKKEAAKEGGGKEGDGK